METGSGKKGKRRSLEVRSKLLDIKCRRKGSKEAGETGTRSQFEISSKERQ